MILYVQWMPDSSCHITATEHCYHQTSWWFSKQLSAWLNLLIVTHAGRLRRAKGYGPSSPRGWLHSHHVGRKNITQTERELTLCWPLHQLSCEKKQQVASAIFYQFYLPGWNVPPSPTFSFKVTKKKSIPPEFLINIYTPWEGRSQTSHL